MSRHRLTRPSWALPVVGLALLAASVGVQRGCNTQLQQAVTDSAVTRQHHVIADLKWDKAAAAFEASQRALDEAETTGPAARRTVARQNHAVAAQAKTDADTERSRTLNGLAAAVPPGLSPWCG